MKFTKLTPFGKRVILRLDSTKTMTEGGIIIPESAQRPSNTATVVSVGDECTKVIAGKKVLLPQNIGTEIEMLGETFFMVFEGDIDGEIE